MGGLEGWSGVLGRSCRLGILRLVCYAIVFVLEVRETVPVGSLVCMIVV